MGIKERDVKIDMDEVDLMGPPSKWSLAWQWIALCSLLMVGALFPQYGLLLFTISTSFALFATWAQYNLIRELSLLNDARSVIAHALMQVVAEHDEEEVRRFFNEIFRSNEDEDGNAESSPLMIYPVRKGDSNA